MKNFYINLNQIKSNPDGQPTVNRQSRLMSYRGNLKNLAMLFAVLMLSIANIATAWGTAPITDGTSATAGASGTVTFEDWTSLIKEKNYWKDGIKFWNWSRGTVSSDADNFTTAVGFGYYSDITAGSGWGSYSMSGLVGMANFALGISVTTPSVIEIIVDNNQNNDLTLANLSIYADNVAYEKPYSSSNYTTGTDIKSRAWITRVVDGKGRYKINIPVFASDLSGSNPYIVKLFEDNSSWSNPLFFVFESITVTPYIYLTDVKSSPESGPTASNSSLTYDNTIFSQAGFTKWGQTSGASGYYELAWSSALDLSGYTSLYADVWWGANNTSNRGIQLFVNNGSSLGSEQDNTKTILIHTKSLGAITSLSTLRIQGVSGGGNSVFFRVGIRGTAVASKDYTVTASTSTGTDTYGTVEASASSLDKDETTTITATPATGYQVTNWAVSGTGASISPSGASNSTTTTLTMGTEDATVTATFGPKSYSISYKDKDNVKFSGLHESGRPSKHTYGSETILKTAFKDSYAFAGWYTSSSCTGDAVTSLGATDYDDDIILYARWVELDLHEPGIYEKPEANGGYGRPLKLNSGHDYEVYYVKVDSLNGSEDKGCLYAGSKLTISDGYSMFKIGYQAGTEIKSEDGWVAFKAYKYGGKNGASCSDAEFKTTTGGKMYYSNYARLNDTHYVRMYIQGYDEFAFIGHDKNTEGDNFVVKIDGVTATPSSPEVYTPNTSRHLTRYSISANKPHFIEVLGNSEKYNNFRGFSLRLPDVTRYTVSATNTDGYGSVDVTSISNVRSGSTIYTSSNTLTVGGTTVTATENSSTAQYSYAFNNWTKGDGTALPGTVTGAITVRANFTQTPVNYTLAWNANGGDALSGTYTSGSTGYGTAITKPNDPTRDGYTFTGWNTEDDGSGDDYTGTMPAANTTYYAQWTKLYASGTYQFDGHLTVGTSPGMTVTTSEVSYDAFRIDNLFFSGSKIQFEGTDGTPQGDGDDYKGWKMKTNNSTIKFFVEYDSDVEVSIGGIGSSSSCKISYTDQSSVDHSNTSISAGNNPSYEVKAGTMVTITFTVDEGNKKSVTLKRIAISETAACTNPSASLSDGAYEVLGTALDLRTLWSSSNTTDGVTFTVTNAGGTSGTIAGDGYSFSASAAGSATIRAVQTSTGAYCDADETATITVTMPTYDVTLNTNGGTINPGNNVTSYTYGVGATLPTDVTKSGYTFNGWYDNSGLTGDAVTTIADDATGNKEYWAKWTELEEICETMDDAFAASKPYGYKTINDAEYDIDAEDISTSNGVYLMTEAQHEAAEDEHDYDNYMYLSIGDRGIIKEIKITVKNIGDANDDAKGIQYTFYEEPVVGYVAPSAMTTSRYSIGATETFSIRPSSGDNVAFGFRPAGTWIKIESICIYYEVPCMKATITKNSSSYSLSSGETKDITSDATITSGGAVKLVNYNASSRSFSFSAKGVAPGTSDGYVEVVLPSGSILEEDAVIRITGEGTEDGAGLLLIDDDGNTIASQTNNGAIDFSYTVTSSSTLRYLNHIRIKRAKISGKNYFKSVTITGCMSCTALEDLDLSYSATTLYTNGGTPRQALPTLTGNDGGGIVTYSSSNTDVVTVNASTGVVTAVGAGTAKVTATIAAVDDYCPARASVNFTVPAFIQQTINLNSAWSTVPNMTFPGDPTETLTKNANIAATGYSIDESNNKSGLSSLITGIPSSTSKNDSYYMSLKFNTPSYPVRLSGVTVKIRPIDKTASAIVTVSDGTTTVTSNEVADMKAGSTKGCNFAITPTVFAAGSTITVKIFVYDQSSNTGFRLGSPILVNGSVLVDQRFTDANSTGLWSDPANWDGGSLPEIYHDVVIEKPVAVDIAHATAKSIVIYNNGSDKTGKLAIQPNKGLEVDGTIQKTTDGSTKTATGEADLVLESLSAGNASLIFNNSNSCQATVQMYSKGNIDGTTWNWQYVGTPFAGSIPQYNYYGSWMYKWNNGWKVVHGTDELSPFVGYCLTQQSPTTHVMGGTLVATDGNDQSVTMGVSTDMVLANSWTAPIYIGGFTAETFTSAPATIYLFNTGMAENGSEEYVSGDEAGTYVTVPVNSAPYTGNELIAPMQGFFVTTVGGSAGTITMKYDELVRPSDSRGIIAGPMKAPKRIEERPEVMKIRAEGSVYNDRVVILSREDFSQGFDNGWDGKKMSFGNASPSVYVINEEGGYDAVSAIPEYEGTVVGFRAGTDSEYTIRFEYDGEEMLYLNDLQEQEATPIDSMRTYTFTAEAGDNEARFIISATPVQKVTTGVDPASGGQDAKVRKVIINDHIYIIRGGRMYSAEGALVK